MDRASIMRGARYHEAGHAVAAFHNGFTVTSVIVTDNIWIANHRRRVFGGWSESWREACVTLAGQFADQRASWGEIRPESWEAFSCEAESALEMAQDDEEFARCDHVQLLQQLEEMAADLHGDPLEDSYHEVVEDTLRLVSDHWHEIEALARALEQNGTLDGAEVVRTIKGARPTTKINGCRDAPTAEHCEKLPLRPPGTCRSDGGATSTA